MLEVNLLLCRGCVIVIVVSDVCFDKGWMKQAEEGIVVFRLLIRDAFQSGAVRIILLERNDALSIDDGSAATPLLANRREQVLITIKIKDDDDRGVE